MTSTLKIPVSTVSRLSVYLRCLRQAALMGDIHLSSRDLEQRTGIHSAQVRKDLAYFGQFGRRGVGYPCEALAHAIAGILGLDRDWSVAVIGAGRLGTALLMYAGFKKMSFKLVAAFDTDADKIDWEVEGIRIRPLSELAEAAGQLKIDIAILAVPADSAQEAASMAAAAGIPALLNFTPARIVVPESVSLRDVDLSSELEALTFLLKDRR
jgi:redox-sensing transcriptional repressor